MMAAMKLVLKQTWEETHHVWVDTHPSPDPMEFAHLKKRRTELVEWYHEMLLSSCRVSGNFLSPTSFQAALAREKTMLSLRQETLMQPYQDLPEGGQWRSRIHQELTRVYDLLDQERVAQARCDKATDADGREHPEVTAARKWREEQPELVDLWNEVRAVLFLDEGPGHGGAKGPRQVPPPRKDDTEGASASQADLTLSLACHVLIYDNPDARCGVGSRAPR